MQGVYVVLNPHTHKEVCVVSDKGDFIYFEMTAPGVRHTLSDPCSLEELPDYLRESLALINLSPTGSVKGVGFKDLTRPFGGI